jgi:hypothetical protein
MLKKPSSPVRGSGYFLTRKTEKDRNLKNFRPQKRGEKKSLLVEQSFTGRYFRATKTWKPQPKERSPFLQLKRKN